MQNSIKNMVLDNKGYVWMASETGLIKYDGKSFSLYNHVNTPVIKNDRFSAIGLTYDSSVFAADADENYYFLLNNGLLQPILYDSLAKRIPPFSASLYVYKIYNKCLTKFHQQKIPENALPDYRLISRSSLNSMAIHENKVFYFNKDRQLFCVDTALATFQQFSFSGELFRQLQSANIETTPVSLLSSGNDIFLRWDAFIYKLNISMQYKTVTGKAVLKVDSIANITSYKTLPGAGIHFVGTMADGLYVFRQQHFSTLTLANKEANIFYAQQPYEKDGVIMKKGVLFADKFIAFEAGYTSESILKTKEGSYYLHRKNGDSSSIDVFDSKLKKINSLSIKDDVVRCFNQLQDGSVWFASDETFLGEIKNTIIEKKQRPANLPEGFSISVFIEIGDALLLAGGEKGLAVIDIAKNSATVFPSLKNAHIRCLYKDSKGAILIGTYGAGFYALYKNKVIAFPLDAKHYLTSAHTFLEDSNGFVWISTNRGLFQVALSDMHNYLNGKMRSLYYYYYDNTAGFLSNEFNGGCVPSGIRLANGKFSLPSMKGLVQFYPDSIKPVFPVSKIYVEGIVADTSFIAYDDHVIKMPHNTSLIKFFISSPYYENEYNQIVEYSLHPLSAKWNTLNDNGIIQYNGLQTGSYTLTLRKKAGFGKNNFITKTILFEVAPAFYETLVAKLVIAVLFVGLLYAFYYGRLKLLLIQKRNLKKEVLKRTKEQHALIHTLENMVTDLEQSKEELHQNIIFKEKLVRIISHDIQSPLRFLADIAHQLYSKTSNDVSEVKNLSWQLEKASVNMYHFVEDLSLWLTKMQSGIQVKYSWHSATNLVNDLLPLFAEQSMAKGNTIVTAIEPGWCIYTDRDMLKTILRNLVDNANKHTSNGSISITMKAGSEEACLIVRDTGSGICPEILQKIQQQLKQTVNDYKNSGRTSGFGYMFIADFVRLLQLGIEIESKAEEGTGIILKHIKIKKEKHYSV